MTRPERTGLLLVDPYNDFLSDGGKIFPRLKPIAEQVGLLDNMRATVAAIRRAGMHGRTAGRAACLIIKGTRS